jgi:glycosyltransferase involved in cell wall biosynthesis
MTKFSILVPTYQRKDGSTPFYLKRCIDSIFNQDYKNFKIFIIGDRYENNEEFVSICESYDQTKIYYENLPVAAERDKYTDKWLIWKYGGTVAANYGIEKSIEMGYDYICHLDHDDEWEVNHLSSLKLAIEKTDALWLCTKSLYVHGLVYPRINGHDELIPFYPMPESLIHSSVCMNFKEIPLRYRNVYEETGVSGLPGDGDLWLRVSEYLKSINKTGYLVNKITCKHLEEGYEQN